MTERMNVKHPDYIVDQIIHLKQHGYKSRAIASILGIGKSSVNDTWNRYKEKQSNPLKILFFDLESTPSIVAAFGRWQQNIGPDSVIREGGYLLSAAWKFAHEDAVSSEVLTPAEAMIGDDFRIIAALYDAFEQADVVVAHNALKFDVPLFKTRLIANGMPPPKRVKVVDTMRIAKSLRFNSNKLDSLGHYLGVGRKIPTTGMSLWLKCMEGDVESLDLMQEYNKQDVILLERVYNKLRAFDNNSPNAGLMIDDGHMHCPVCGSGNLKFTGNNTTTKVSVFKEVQCNDCGHRSRTRQAINSVNHRKNQLA